MQHLASECCVPERQRQSNDEIEEKIRAWIGEDSEFSIGDYHDFVTVQDHNNRRYWWVQDEQQKQLNEEHEERIRKWIAEASKLSIDDQLELADNDNMPFKLLVDKNHNSRSVRRKHNDENEQESVSDLDSPKSSSSCFAGILRILMN